MTTRRGTRKRREPTRLPTPSAPTILPRRPARCPRRASRTAANRRPRFCPAKAFPTGPHPWLLQVWARRDESAGLYPVQRPDRDAERAVGERAEQPLHLLQRGEAAQRGVVRAWPCALLLPESRQRLLQINDPNHALRRHRPVGSGLQDRQRNRLARGESKRERVKVALFHAGARQAPACQHQVQASARPLPFECPVALLVSPESRFGKPS